jgi:peptidoglycan/LPS O-acetylase OafA/YrhL
MQQKTRAASFLLVMSWIYLLLGLGMIGLALYNLTRPDLRLTFAGVTDAVFLIIGGALGFLAGIFGLVSRQLKRCRIMGLVLLAIAAVPLAINLLAGLSFQTYWKNIAVMLLPFLYLFAALLKRSEKKPTTIIAQPTSIQHATSAPQASAEATVKPEETADSTQNPTA